MKHLLSLVFFFTVSSCYAQVISKRLVAAEYRIDSPRVGNFTYLVAYNFSSAGTLVSKDTLFGAPTDRPGIPGSYVRYDLGENFIYKNRYVVSGCGNVIDLEKGALVIEESDDFISAHGDSLIFHRNNIFTGTGYLPLDLKTGKYGFINHEGFDYEIEEGRSPDKKHYLTVDRSDLPYKIWLHNDKSGKKIVVPDAGNGPNLLYDSQFPTIETFWQNNNVFLYTVHETKFNASRQHYSKVTLHRYDIRNSVDKVFFVLDSVGDGLTNDRFSRDKTGQLIYKSCAWAYYLVDTAAHVLKDYPFLELGNNFSIANRFSKTGTTLRYQNTDIGTIWGNSTAVTKDAIAIEFDDPGANLAYPKGIMVWSKAANKWTTMEIPWLCSAIGWIDGK